MIPAPPRTDRQPRSRRRRFLRWLLPIVLLGTLALVVSVIPFLRPAMDRPPRADAIVVLAGDPGERLQLALRMARDGVAPTLVWAGEREVPASQRLCRETHAFEVICLDVERDSTRNEARATARLAARRGWRHLVVVTSTFHVTRSRLLFERCVDGRVDVAGADHRYPFRLRLRILAHEWLGTAHALAVERGC